MKLTKQTLYNLIKEELQKGTAERRWGPGVTELINAPRETYMLPDGKVNVGWFEQNIGKYLGEGYSRMVFDLDINHTPPVVLKLAFESDQPNSYNEGIQSNQLEAQLFDRYPHCFPKTFGMFRGGEIILMEKVNVIEERNHYNMVLENSFPSLGQGVDFLMQLGVKRIDVSWVWEKLLDSWDEIILGKDEVAPSRYDFFMDELGSSVYGVKLTQQDKEKFFDLVTYDSRLMLWITTLRKLGVEFDEIRVGNVGTNTTDDKLMLIDISKFNFGG